MSAITLTDLNNFMRDYPSLKITPYEITEAPLLEALKSNIDTESFIGQNIDMLIQTSRPYRGRPFGEGRDLPTPGAPSFSRVQVPLREIMTTAGITRQAMMRATGGAASWGRAVDLALKDAMIDWKNILDISCIGDGTGKLGRLNGAPTNANGGTTVTYTLDNTYDDFGWENTALIKVGMLVDLWDDNGNAWLNTGTSGVVTAVTFGNRRNGGATTGTVTVDWLTNAEAERCDDNEAADNDILYIGGAYDWGATVHPHARTILPRGLVGLCSGGNWYSGEWADFQGHTRTDSDAEASVLSGRRYRATDFGLASENPVNGTPTVWDTSDWTDVIMDIRRGAGKGKVNLILVGSALALCLDRKAKTEGNALIVVDSSRGLQGQPVAGAKKARTFLGPDGEEIPIECAETIPANCAYFITKEDLTWYPLGDADFLREYGDIWEPARGNRRTEFEAPYGWFYEIGAQRCDNLAVMQDLRTDIA